MSADFFPVGRDTLTSPEEVVGRSYRFNIMVRCFQTLNGSTLQTHGACTLEEYSILACYAT